MNNGTADAGSNGSDAAADSGVPGPTVDASVADATDLGNTDGGDAPSMDGGDAALLDAADAGKRDGGGAWRCKNTGTITCECQEGADVSNYPITDCKPVMADGQRFCASAIAVISGFDIGTCKCWKTPGQIAQTKTDWANSTQVTYKNITDQTNCPPTL